MGDWLASNWIPILFFGGLLLLALGYILPKDWGSDFFMWTGGLMLGLFAVVFVLIIGFAVIMTIVLTVIFVGLTIWVIAG